MRNFLKKHDFAVALTLAILIGGVLGLLNWLPRTKLMMALALGGVYAVYDWKGRKRKLPQGDPVHIPPCTSPFSVSFDETEVVAARNGSRHESVRWSDLIFVGIRIENQGWIDEPYWVLGGRAVEQRLQGCIFPISAAGAKEILAEMQRRLPGFDNEAFIKAMGMLEGGVTIWTEAGSVPAAPEDKSTHP